MSAFALNQRLALPLAAALALAAGLGLAQNAFRPGQGYEPMTPAYERALQAMQEECAGEGLNPAAVETCGRLALLLRRMLAPADSSDLVIAADEWREMAAEAADVQGSPAPRMTQAEHSAAQMQRCVILDRACD